MPARVLFSIGTLALYSASDLPQTLVLERQTSGAAQTLSDGTRVWQGSGIVAVDFILSVLLYTTDEGGTPQNKLDALTFMQDSRQRYPFSFRNHHFPVEVVGLKVTEDKTDDLAVDITLFRPAAGPLVSATQPAPGTTASQSMDRIAALAAQVASPTTQAAILTVQQGRALAGR